MSKRTDEIILLNGVDRKVYDFLKANPKSTLRKVSEKFPNAINPITNLRLKNLVIIDRVREEEKLVNAYSVLQ